MYDVDDLKELQELWNENTISTYEYHYYVSLLIDDRDDRDEDQNTISEIFHNRNIHYLDS